VTAAVAVDLDGALGNTRRLWDAFLEDAARRFRSIAVLDPRALPRDRAVAAAELDRWAEQGVGDWRSALARFAEDHAPVHLRPSSSASAALRQLQARGVRIGVYTDAPEVLARVALAYLGAARRVDLVETGADARARLLKRLGDGVTVADSPEALARVANCLDDRSSG
jgi:phosphoglycolate phosphatase-like HAD superfamily hydrolase